MLVYIQTLIAIALGVVSSITDFKNKKIYNKNIIIAVGLSGLTYLIFFKQIENLQSYLINLIITIIISFIFFYLKIWAAGDAKLFLAIVFMIPFELYEVSDKNIFPALLLLIMMFSIAFIYVVFETFYLWGKDEDRLNKIQITNIDKTKVKDFILQYFMGYFIILFINNIVLKFFMEFKINNGGLMLLFNMLVLIFTYRIIKGKRKSLIVTSVFAILNFMYYALFGLQIYSLNIKMLIIVLIILIFRAISEKYNYEEIKIIDLKPSMILSYESVIKFYSSRVKGLPRTTTETTDSRLTETEVESIKRWSKTTKGQDTIIIVRHMPFAPFIFVGEVLFFILKLLV